MISAIVAGLLMAAAVPAAEPVDDGCGIPLPPLVEAREGGWATYAAGIDNRRPMSRGLTIEFRVLRARKGVSLIAFGVNETLRNLGPSDRVLAFELDTSRKGQVRVKNAGRYQNGVGPFGLVRLACKLPDDVGRPAHVKSPGDLILVDHGRIAHAKTVAANPSPVR